MSTSQRSLANIDLHGLEQYYSNSWGLEPYKHQISARTRLLSGYCLAGEKPGGEHLLEELFRDDLIVQIHGLERLHWKFNSTQSDSLEEAI